MRERSYAPVVLISFLFASPANPSPQFVHVCQDAGAGGYEAFPDVCRVAEGRLMCVFYAGHGHVSVPSDRLPRGGRISACVSEDEGRTWSAARVIFDSPDDDRHPSITRLSGGRLICTFFIDPGKGSWRILSDDGGSTWSAPAPISSRHSVSSPVRELSDGTLMLGLYHERDGMAGGAVVTSEDHGDTWRDVVEIDDAGKVLDGDTDVIELANGDIFAALRGREEMHWSRSVDRGRTWSPATSFGSPGQGPYLHRTVDGVFVLAHGVPAPSLRFSVDGAATWSPVVRCDDVGGANPSMVNLVDGSVLMVYCDGGPGSSIRARRFRITRSGVRWLLAADESLATSGARLVDVRRIWDEGPHNAFTDLVRFRGRWFCVFREGQGHVSPDGALRVIASDDGRTWSSVARVTSEVADLRDPKITATPSGQLMLSGAGALHSGKPRHQSFLWLSEDGEKWSPSVKVADPNFWLWRVSWHGATAYGIGYSTLPERSIRLYRSQDGREFETLVDDLGVEQYPNETSILFLEDDTALCLLRRDLAHGLLGRSRPPYAEWTWKDVGTRIGGPHMIRIPDGRLVAAVRLYDGGARTSLCRVDPGSGSLSEFLELPSGGDTSYAGLVWHDERLWVSYYSSHEGKTSVYLARVAFSTATGR